MPITHCDMEEIWKDIPGYEGLYEASNLGRVRSIDRIIEGHVEGILYKRHFGGCKPDPGSLRGAAPSMNRQHRVRKKAGACDMNPES